LILIILHVFRDVIKERYHFTPQLDSTILGLLAFAALPVIWEIVDTVKAGGVEVSFRQLPVHQQIFELLDSIATQRMWTFYPPRSDKESALGEGLGVLIEKLNEEHKKDLIKRLETWLQGKSDNLKWFATEIIGYHKIAGFESDLRNFQPQDKNTAWAPWQLNAMWAYSRVFNYAWLKDFLMNTNNDFNQGWVLDAYSQMAQTEKEEKVRQQFAAHLNEFKDRPDITSELKIKAGEVYEVLAKS
jgi:hypothetical protein